MDESEILTKHHVQVETEDLKDSEKETINAIGQKATALLEKLGKEKTQTEFKKHGLIMEHGEGWDDSGQVETTEIQDKNGQFLIRHKKQLEKPSRTSSSLWIQTGVDSLIGELPRPDNVGKQELTKDNEAFKTEAAIGWSRKALNTLEEISKQSS